MFYEERSFFIIERIVAVVDGYIFRICLYNTEIGVNGENGRDIRVRFKKYVQFRLIIIFSILNIKQIISSDRIGGYKRRHYLQAHLRRQVVELHFIIIFKKIRNASVYWEHGDLFTFVNDIARKVCAPHRIVTAQIFDAAERNGEFNVISVFGWRSFRYIKHIYGSIHTAAVIKSVKLFAERISAEAIGFLLRIERIKKEIDTVRLTDIVSVGVKRTHLPHIGHIALRRYVEIRIVI